MPLLPKPSRPDFLGFLALVAILAVMLGAYLVFPHLQAAMGYQDCIASGRVTGC
ncbi:hypothetical protein SAMN04487779_101388 [Belnapia rosea]|uniref:Uncharacterized protein n=1 Tax=Belnapia rosea TaxID=938405 RepID=A0A1G6Y3J2_9PROT|nr:hypothetical protein SAMN04487779_101388 [Belnapia rosea]